MVIRTLDTSEVFVAGGGPAGVACAIALAMRGIRVRVADAMRPPIEKACGEGLMPDTLAALDALGVRLDEDSLTGSHAECAPICGIRFIDTASGAAAQAAFPAGDGRGMKRRLLHTRLIERAEELGVAFSWDTIVRSISHAGAETNRGLIRAGYIVGADGLQSRVRAWARLERASKSKQRIGLRQHFAASPWTDFVEVYWADCGQAYVTPVAGNELCVAFVARAKFASVAAALNCFPQLQEQLANAPVSDAPRGSVTFSRKLHRVTQGNIALLGDASGSVDAVTGEGLSLCFRQALALADAIAANDLASYEKAHAAMAVLPRRMASTMLLMDRSKLLRSGAITVLKRRPRLFAQLLELHIGHKAVRVFGESGLVAAGLKLVAS